MRHAYCIMAHGNFDLLQILINLIDDERNTIFLHIDKKSKLCNNITSKFSNIYLIQSQDVRWADISQTEVECLLFDEVLKTKIQFDRVHLISGSCLPLKSQDYIHSFFDASPNVEFLTILDDSAKYRIRLEKYHFFVKHIRHSKSANILRRILLLFQYPFINRLKNSPFPFQCGHNWCSITLRAVKTIVEQYKLHKKIFAYSTSSDECYKQMILKNDNSFVFSENGNLRYVKWGAGKVASPEILTITDFDSIVNSNCLFARKFDLSVDSMIVENIIHKIESDKHI